MLHVSNCSQYDYDRFINGIYEKCKEKLMFAFKRVKSWNIIIEKNTYNKLWKLNWSSSSLFKKSLWMKYELLEYIIIFLFSSFTTFFEAELLIEPLSLIRFKIIINWTECN